MKGSLFCCLFIISIVSLTFGIQEKKYKPTLSSALTKKSSMVKEIRRTTRTMDFTTAAKQVFGSKYAAQEGIYLAAFAKKGTKFYSKRAQVIGRYAEHWLVRKKKWKLAGNPVDKQHDLWKKNTIGSGTRNAQVKVHLDGNPKTYVKDMVQNDNASQTFFVPDDHYNELKNEIEKSVPPHDRKRQQKRLTKMGISSKGLSLELNQTGKQAFRKSLIRSTDWLITGTFMYMSTAPSLIAYGKGEISKDQLFNELLTPLSYVGAGIGVNLAYSAVTRNLLKSSSRWKTGLGIKMARSSLLKGSILFAADLAVTEIFLMEKYGFGSQEFLDESINNFLKAGTITLVLWGASLIAPEVVFAIGPIVAWQVDLFFTDKSKEDPDFYLDKIEAAKNYIKINETFLRN